MLKNRLNKKNNKSYEDIHYSCTIRFLDDSEPLSVSFQKETKGQYIVDYVCKELNLLEQDYFGLRYVDSEKQRHWLDPWKNVYRQLKNVNPMVLCFRVKFYPTDPAKLKEEITRYFLFLQLRRDLHHGRLLCSPSDGNLLAAYIIQSELGDFDPQDHPPGYIAEFKMLPKQTQKQEEKIAELHKTLVGQVPSEAEMNFLKKTCSLDTYGVDPHPVKDQRGNQMYLGVTHLGIVTFQGNKRTHLFKWPQITKIAFEGKMFIVHVTISEGEENALYFKRKKHACGFKCPTYTACKHLWKCAVEQQYFFTLQEAAEARKVTSGGGIFSRGSKFRFSGRCQREVYVQSSSITREEPKFQRSSSNPNFTRTFGVGRSVSLPSKGKPLAQSLSDVLTERNHVASSLSTSDLDAGAKVLNDTQTSEPLDTSIPEEPSVEIGSVSYDPLASPSQEDLPPFPGAPPADTTGDIDHQIEQLETELQQFHGDGNQIPQERAVDVQGLPPLTGGVGDAEDHLDGRITEPNEYHLPTSPVNNLATIEEQENGEETPTPPMQQRGVACCRVLTVGFSVIFTIMLIMLFCVLESELDVPVLRDLRAMPEVQDFKHQHYNPFKTTVTQKMGGWFKA